MLHLLQVVEFWLLVGFYVLLHICDEEQVYHADQHLEVGRVVVAEHIYSNEEELLRGIYVLPPKAVTPEALGDYFESSKVSVRVHSFPFH